MSQGVHTKTGGRADAVGGTDPATSAGPRDGIRVPLCGHSPEALERLRDRIRCRLCGSFWDPLASGEGFVYADDYPEIRGHFDERIGALKVRSLERWLAETGIGLEGATVCEVGFGGGHTLQWLAGQARSVCGLEAVQANLERARSSGIDDVYDFEERPAALGRHVDLWLFLDSFEHLPDPEAFLGWMVANSSPRARVLLVLPEAGSTSERWLGRWWLHRLPDHAFHWSRAGLRGLFERSGFRLVAEFHPGKYVSGATIASHLTLMMPRLRVVRSASHRLAGLSVYFNVGEMGVVFERDVP